MAIGLALALVGAQAVRPERTNPPVTAEVPAPPDVRALLHRACYDCHSHATRWPWYSGVAPVSWLVADDVRHARRHVNFTTWDAYDAAKRRKKFEEIADEVEEHEMPLWFYVPLHREARLTDAERARLVAWARASAAEAAP